MSSLPSTETLHLFVALVECWYNVMFFLPGILFILLRNPGTFA